MASFGINRFKFQVFAVFLCHCLINLNAYSQNIDQYRYESDFLSKEFHSSRREALRALLPDGSCAIIFSNPIRNRAADQDYEYHQNPDFYYVSGFREPNSILLIWKDEVNIGGKNLKEIMFVPERDAYTEMWNGKRAGPEGAQVISGISSVYPGGDFYKMNDLFADVKKIL
ncbi:MAG: aminopeptidase P N-terminal domain-containing protein, partial [Bacteroidia bacterium]|nr:aminopeptidase P N-terminal domain-containing protein [Bacteroidia bacterium]